MIQTEYFPQAGDVFACWGSDWMSWLISLQTSRLLGPHHVRWAPSHVAIACPRWYHEHQRQCYWWESTSITPRPCLETGKPVAGCQVHRIKDRIRDYVLAGGRVSVYRLTDFDTLRTVEVDLLRDFLGQCIQDQKPIQYDTAGALFSGTRIVRHFTMWRNQLDRLFCSELLSAVLQRLGRMSRQNPSNFTPGRLMRRLITEGSYQLHTEFRCKEDWRLQ